MCLHTNSFIKRLTRYEATIPASEDDLLKIESPRDVNICFKATANFTIN